MVIAAFVVCFLWKDLLVQDSSDSSLIDDDGAGLIFFRLIIPISSNNLKSSVAVTV